MESFTWEPKEKVFWVFGKEEKIFGNKTWMSKTKKNGSWYCGGRREGSGKADSLCWSLEEGADGENRLRPSVDSPQRVCWWEERYVPQFLCRNLPITSLNLVIVVAMDENMLLCYTSSYINQITNPRRWNAVRDDDVFFQSVDIYLGWMIPWINDDERLTFMPFSRLIVRLDHKKKNLIWPCMW